MLALTIYIIQYSCFIQALPVENTNKFSPQF